MKADADYWKGFWAGRAIAVRLAGLKAPEAAFYLYNGHRLPKLPEWDAYPCIMVCRAAPWTDYHLYAVANKPYVYLYSDGSGKYLAFGENRDDTVDYMFCSVGEEDTSWSEAEIRTGKPTITVDYTLKWTNFDVYDTSGALRFEASDPIPTT